MNRENLILFDAYERAFTSVCIRDKIIVPFFPGESIGQDKLKALYDFTYNELYRYNPLKEAVLQMVLLSDEITIMDFPIGYNLDKISSYGFIKTITIEEDDKLAGYSFSNDDIELLLSSREVIINSLKSIFQNDKLLIFELNNFDLTLDDFLYALFDITFFVPADFFLIEIHEKTRKYLNNYKTTRYNPKQWENIGINKDDAIDIIGRMWKDVVAIETGKYFSLLNHGEQIGGAIMQNKYKMPTSISRLNSNNKKIIDCYNILRVTYNDSIGVLPKLNSLEDVLRLKDKRPKDIKRLNEILKNIEIELRNGSQQALIKAKSEINTASKELCKNNNHQKISKWTTYLSLPISTIEILLGLPPIAGISVAALGTSYTLKSEYSKRKNNWLQVIR